MAAFISYLKKKPLVTAVVAVAVSVLAVLLPQGTYWNRCVLRILMCGTMLFFLYLVSGEKTIVRSDGKQIGYVFRHYLGYLIFSAAFGVLGAFSQLAEGVQPGVPGRFVSLALMFLFACLYEELCFRAVLNDAIVRQFRDKKGVFAISAVVSSLVFGLVHITGSPVTNASQFAQAAFKTLSCAVGGLAFLILYWKTRDVWAVGLAHAAYDFLGETALVLGNTTSIGAGSYVQEEEVGLAGFAMLGFQLLVCSLITLWIWKKVGKTIDFEEMRKNW